VDLNLQFPAGWDMAKKIKFEQGYNRPAPRDYVGQTPLSVPESIAMFDFTRNHDFSLILAYHTQGEVIYWKYLDEEPEGAETADSDPHPGYLLSSHPETEYPGIRTQCGPHGDNKIRRTYV